MKTSELTGAALDWAVTRANYEINHETVWEQDRDTCEYSTDWAQAGPIIEREKIELSAYSGCWEARYWEGRAAALQGLPPDVAASTLRARKIPLSVARVGPTPLVAAMRCFVAGKLGDDVTVPDGLV